MFKVRCPLLFLLSLLASFPAFAERFGDMVVAPQSLVSGETLHGYREIRVLLENQSLKSAHRVTLVYPNRSYGSGNHLNRVSRTVTLNPLSRVIVPLWLPPLPATGDGVLRLEIDDEDPQTIALPGGFGHAGQHASRYTPRYGGSRSPSTILVSRSLNFDELQRAFKSELAGSAAIQATGPANSSGLRGPISAAWMPDYRRPQPHWIELEYHKPIAADRLCIHETLGYLSFGEIILTGVSGTNLVRVPLTPTSSTWSRRLFGNHEYSFALTSEPVKTVRLEFNTRASSICIDAVQLANSAASNSVWASSARASSEGGAAMARGGPVEAHSLLRAESPVADWSEYWLSYTPFDAIALAAADLKSLSPAIQTALWRYAESGGNLVILGGAGLPPSWTPLPNSRLEGGRRFNAGLGQCFVFESSRLPALPRDSGHREMLDTIAATARYWQNRPDASSANDSFPVTENYRVPVRGTVFIMLAFVLLIGPVNLFVLWRLNRRMWLLWTIPAISAVTCLLVFAYSLLREGVTPAVRTESLTLLDQTTRRAVTVGMTAFYCPLTPSQGLGFGLDTEATPLLAVNEWSNSGSGREMDWTQAQHLRRGWVTARVPAHFQLRKSETRRERLQLDNTNGQLSVVNGLGATIRRLWLADASGFVLQAANIPAGQKADLALDGAYPKLTQRLGPREFLEQMGWTARKPDQQDSYHAYLLPNTYIAELTANPFLENGLGAKAKSARSRECTIVFGILDVAGAKTVE